MAKVLEFAKKDDEDGFDERLAELAADEVLESARMYLRNTMLDASEEWGVPDRTLELTLQKICEGLQKMAFEAMQEGRF